jgi:glycosyltransferase involved in cell wall biosynthesis
MVFMRPFVSLTIPCYNEGSFIFKAVKELEQVMDESPYKYEIILFDDKSSDATARNIAEIAKKNSKVRAFFHARNQGRGQTVKDAIMKAGGEIVGFVDIDLEVAAHYVPVMVRAVESGFDVAIADRIAKIDGRVLIRHVLSKAYQVMVKRLLGVAVNDTEAGCKFFKRKSILPVLRETRDKHWFWDTEVMALAKFHGLRVKEIPVVFTTNPETKSTVRVFSDIVKYLKAIRKFRKRMKQKG